jgi:hypothetical protein
MSITGGHGRANVVVEGGFLFTGDFPFLKLIVDPDRSSHDPLEHASNSADHLVGPVLSLDSANDLQ